MSFAKIVQKTYAPLAEGLHDFDCAIAPETGFIVWIPGLRKWVKEKGFGYERGSTLVSNFQRLPFVKLFDMNLNWRKLINTSRADTVFGNMMVGRRKEGWVATHNGMNLFRQGFATADEAKSQVEIHLINNLKDHFYSTTRAFEVERSEAA